jgi:hypothetical protein
MTSEEMDVLPRLIPIAVVIALAAPVAPAGSDEDPAGSALNEFVAAVNSGDEANYRRFVEARLGGKTSEQQDDWVDWIGFLGGRHKGLKLALIAERPPGAIVGYVNAASSDTWLKIAMEVEADPPYDVSSIGVRKALALSPVAVPALTPERVDAVLAAIATEIRRDYVRHDFREELISSLQARAEVDNFRAITNRFELARRISEALDEIADDEHLNLQAPDFAEAIRERYYSDEEDAPQQEVESDDHGFTRAELLTSDVAILEMSRFDGSAAARATLERLLTPLAEASALVIDLRYSGGGDGEMVIEIASYLFAEPTEIGTRIKQQTTPRFLSKAFVDKPVYILTSSTTRSAAEALAFDLQQKGRAKLFGAVTAGAGYMSDYRFLPGDFVLSLSIGDPYDAQSGGGWERVGVKPDVECAVEEALELALADLSS